jgi:TetR/AcrR family transcriptional regulator, acrAB operon repressor
MARKTPEEAALTRQRIVDAARQLFHHQGVSLTTLEQIARHAGVTRGAVYWHFKDKSDLISALRELLTRSMTEHVYSIMLEDRLEDPLAGLEQALKNIFVILENDSAVREILAIWLMQGMLVKELAEANESVVKCHKEFIAKLEHVYQRAKEKNVLHSYLTVELQALETDAFVVGLIRNWLLDACQVRVRERYPEIIAEHIRMRRSDLKCTSSDLS